MQTDFDLYTFKIAELIQKIKKETELPVYFYQFPSDNNINIIVQIEPPILDDHSSIIKLRGGILVQTVYSVGGRYSIDPTKLKDETVIKLFEYSTKIQNVLKSNSDQYNIIDSEFNMYENDSRVGVEIIFQEK